MVNLETKPGSGRLSIHGKRMVAAAWYARGNSFLAAAVLLRQRGGYEYVVLHLICQGVEITLKALLLFANYDRYRGRLKTFGHNLVNLAHAASQEFRVKPMSKALATELEALNSLYAKHLLRYGSSIDILVKPETIASALTLRKMVAVMRLSDRHFGRTGTRI
jgi:HEPN domain-containing protein